MSNEQKWETFKVQIEALGKETRALGVLSGLLADSVAFGAQHKVNFSESYKARVSSAIKRSEELSKMHARAVRTMMAVETKKLGLKFTGNDFNIMAPLSMSAEEQALYRISTDSDLGGFILMAVGAVMLITGLYWAQKEREEASKCYKDHNDLLYETDAFYCNKPDSETCRAWLTRKEQKGYAEKKSWSDQLWDTAKDIGRQVKKGASWGLAIAIPFIAFLIFYRGKR